MRARWQCLPLLAAVLLVALQSEPARAGDPNGWMFRRSYWSHGPMSVPRAYGPAYWSGYAEPMVQTYIQGSVVYGYRHLSDTVHVGSAHDTVYHRERYVRYGPIR